jgi:hypothetical protein
MKKLFLFLFFILLTLSAYAGLGETEKQILVQRPAAQEVTYDKIDDRAKVMLVRDIAADYAAGILDGKCEIEVFNNKDDSKFTSSFIVSHLKAYGQEWIPIECNEDACISAMTVDGKYFSKLGYSKSLNRQNVLTIFTKKWGQYAKEIIANRKIKI